MTPVRVTIGAGRTYDWRKLKNLAATVVGLPNLVVGALTRMIPRRDIADPNCGLRRAGESGIWRPGGASLPPNYFGLPVKYVTRRRHQGALWVGSRMPKEGIQP